MSILVTKSLVANKLNSRAFTVKVLDSEVLVWFGWCHNKAVHHNDQASRTKLFLLITNSSKVLSVLKIQLTFYLQAPSLAISQSFTVQIVSLCSASYVQ